MPISTREYGSDKMVVTAPVAATGYMPTDGTGPKTTAKASCHLQNVPEVTLDGILLLTSHTAARQLDVYENCASAAGTVVGTDTISYSIPIAANQACPFYIPLGGPNGSQSGGHPSGGGVPAAGVSGLFAISQPTGTELTYIAFYRQTRV